MAVTIHLDSAYIGFIFLILTELLLVRVVISAQIRSLDREVKRRLDKGETVELDLKEYGPLKITSRMGYAKVALLIFPAALILIMVALGELGISGRTVASSSTENTVTAGKYYTLQAVEGDNYKRAPYQFAGVWPGCVEYSENSVVARAATIPYEIKEDFFEMGTAVCSTENDVVVTDLASQCNEQDIDSENFSYFYYNVTSVGEMVYFDGYRQNVLGQYVGETTGFIGEVNVGPCSGGDGGPGNVIWVNATNVDDTYAIVDDSWRLGNSTLERWIVDSSASMSLGRHNTGRTVIVECEEGCLEAIVEWCLSEAGTTVHQVSTFLSIWYEGLNYGSDGISPRCDRDFWTNTGWADETETVFKGADCDGVISQSYIPDGGEENVTLVSMWAIWVILIGCALTAVYKVLARKQGYNLLTYEGLSEIYYMDANPGYIWRKGGALEVSLVQGQRDGIKGTLVTARKKPEPV